MPMAKAAYNERKKRTVEKNKVRMVGVKTQMKRVIVEFAKVGVLSIACINVGIHPDKNKKWMDKYPKYDALIKDMKDRFIDGIEGVGYKRAMAGSDSMIQFMLKSHRRETYGDKSQVDLGSQQGSPVTLVFQEGMLNEDEKRLIGGEDIGDSEVVEIQSGEETPKL